MQGSVSVRRAVLVAALTLLGLAGSAPVARAGDFYASGEFTVISTQGNRFELSFDGRARPGGSFTGAGFGKSVANGATQYGEIVWDFGGGDTLTFDVLVSSDPVSGLLVGEYVVTGGTGRLAGASGSGSCTFLGQPLGETGPFEFEGTLSF